MWTGIKICEILVCGANQQHPSRPQYASRFLGEFFYIRQVVNGFVENDDIIAFVGAIDVLSVQLAKWDAISVILSWNLQNLRVNIAARDGFRGFRQIPQSLAGAAGQFK